MMRVSRYVLNATGSMDIPNAGFRVVPLAGPLTPLSDAQKKSVDRGRPLFHTAGPHFEEQKVTFSGTSQKLSGPKAENLHLHHRALSKYATVFDYNKHMKRGDEVISSQQDRNSIVTTLRASIHADDRKSLTTTYRNNRFVILSALLGSLDQGVHFDSLIPGTIIVTTADGKSCPIGIIPYSQFLIRDIKRIRGLWKILGFPAPEGVDCEVLFFF